MSIVYIYIRPKYRSKIRQLAGMLRGLANSYGGFNVVSGLTNQYFLLNNPVCICFSNSERAKSFVKDAAAVFSRYIEVTM